MKHYTDAEKKILIEQFITHPEGHLKRYKEFVQDFYNSLTTDESLVPQVPQYIRTGRKGMQEVINKEGPSVAFDTNDYLWDEKTGDNLLTYMLQQPGFRVTGNTLHQLNWLHPNWKHENKDGLTPLNILAMRGQREYINKLITDFKLDPQTLNKDDKPYTHFFFEGDIEGNSLRQIIHKVFMIKYTLDDYPEHFQISPKRILALQDNVGKIIENFKNEPDNGLYDPAHIEAITAEINEKLNNLSFNRQLKRELPTKSHIKAGKI